jgi:uncharacterized repeat protein (TIGR03803 family)
MLRQRFRFALSAILTTLGMVFMLPTVARGTSTYKLLYAFKGADGSGPSAGLVFDRAGNLYGTTTWGGANGGGTVFKLSPNSDGSWTETVLYSFCSLTSCADGESPSSGLILDMSGSLYGTTYAGGNTNCGGGCGTVFMLHPNSNGSWTESVLHYFCSLANCADGWFPLAGLTFDASGNLYGTTYWGGFCFNYCGVVFKLAPNSNGSWTESVLHYFCSLANCADGQSPSGGLTFDTTGNLYGTAGGGASGYGVVFRLVPNSNGSWKESILHNFCSLKNCVDGWGPSAGLTFDTSGNLYGTTYRGGACSAISVGCGVVFKMTPNSDGTWKESVIHFFQGHPAAQPAVGPTFDPAGNLYGTTLDFDISSNRGTVFRLAPTVGGGGTYNVVHVFHGTPASDPEGDLVFDQAGNLYGTAHDCQKPYNCEGVVYELLP